MRKVIFANNECYHVFNRGVDKRRIFLRNYHYTRFLNTIKQLLTKGTAQAGVITRNDLGFDKRLDIFCYCLMPNHYHLLLRQKEDNAISEFMHNLNTSYTKYFNLNNKRTGRLFEYTFKAVRVETDEHLLHLTRYIHLNPLIANLTTDLETYPWSSYLEFSGKRSDSFCHKDVILSFFSGENPYRDYEKFVEGQKDYARTLNAIKKLLLE